MSITITGTVANGVVVPSSPLPEGARVEIHVSDVQCPNPLLRFSGHIDPNDPMEKEFAEELAAWQQGSAEALALVERLADEAEADEKR